MWLTLAYIMLSERARRKRVHSTMIALYTVQNQKRLIHAAAGSQESDVPPGRVGVVGERGFEGGILGADTVWVFDLGTGYTGVCNLQKFIKALHLYIICTFLCAYYTYLKDLKQGKTWQLLT